MRGALVNIGMLAALVLAFAAVTARAEPVPVTADTTDIYLSPHIELMDDPDGSLTLTEAMSRPYYKDPRPFPIFALNAPVRWARIEIENISGKTLDRLIGFNQLYYHAFSLFLPADGGYRERRSLIGHRRDTDLDRPELVFRVPLPPGRTTLYARVDDVLVNFVVTLRDDTAQANSDVLLLAIQISALAILAVVVLSLASVMVITRNREFLPVTVWAAITLISNAASFGFWRFVLGDEIGTWAAYFGFDMLSIAAACWFLRRFLRFDATTPWVVRPIQIYQAVIIAIIPWHAAAPVSEGWAILALSLPAYALFFAAMMGRIGDPKRGRIFAIGMAPSIVAVFCSEAYYSGFLPLLPATNDILALFQVASMIIMAAGVAFEVEAEIRARRTAIELGEATARSRSDFLATISHEIRTPMTGILGMTELMLARKLDPETRRDAVLVQQSANALRHVINEVLDLTSLEQHRVELHKGPVNPLDLVESIATLFRASAEDKGVALDVLIDGVVPAWVEADAGRLRQIVLNVIANAVKFTRRGSITVRLSSETLPSTERVRLRIAVSDTGIGIAPEALPRLFKRFAQADQSIARQFGGTGLGLAIAKELIELFGGDITVASKPGEGSTFTIWFEAGLSAAPLVQKTEEMPLPRLVPRNLRVLIAEDNEVNRLYVTSLLRGDGHSVDVVENGAEAVAAVKAERYDVVLMDLQMPVLDGIAASRAIRQLPLPANIVPIIALTANASAADREAALAAGMNDHLAKPFNMAELSAALQRATA